MKNFFEKKYIQIGVTLLIVSLIAITFCYLIYHGENVSKFISTTLGILSPIIDGLIISFLLIPIVNFIEHRLVYFFTTPKKKKEIQDKLLSEQHRYETEMNDEEKAAYEKKQKSRFRLKRTISIILTLLFVALLGYAFLYSVIPQIKDSITNIVKKSNQYYNNFNQYISFLENKYPDIAKIVENNWEEYKDVFFTWRDNTLLPKIRDLANTGAVKVWGFFSAVWDIIIGLIISIYIIAEKEKFSAQFKKVFYAILGTKTANKFINNLRFTNSKFSGFIVGKLVDSLIIGFIALIMCYILKFDYPVLIAMIIGVTNIIPFFGPIFGAIPCFILLFLISPIKSLYFVIFVILLQQFDGNILGPKILGESTGVSGLWVIFSITLFGGIWGVPGMIIGVPLFAVLYAAVKTFIETKLGKKELPKDTENYKNLDYIDSETNAFVKHIPDYQVRSFNKIGRELKLPKWLKKKNK